MYKKISRKKNNFNSILVTGGGGYIGSHTTISLLRNGYNVTVIDNFSNCKKNVITKIKKISNNNFYFYKCDVNNYKKLVSIIKQKKIQAIIHFAALKSIEDSNINPRLYFKNNVNGSINLIKATKKCKIKKFIFSSSATVYHQSNTAPFRENYKLGAANPYGETKLLVEDYLKNFCKYNKSFAAICLRYFNPIGADVSGLLGEEVNSKSKNLIPNIYKAIVNKKGILKIFGKKHNTKDGTCIRDFIHINDLVNGHLSALDYLKKKNGWLAINLGTGKGYSVLDVVKCFQKILKIKIKIKYTKKRKGDLSESYANVDKARKYLRWKAKLNLYDMCKSFCLWKKLV